MVELLQMRMLGATNGPDKLLKVFVGLAVVLWGGGQGTGKGESQRGGQVGMKGGGSRREAGGRGWGPGRLDQEHKK